jgi:hypothetical protein
VIDGKNAAPQSCGVFRRRYSRRGGDPRVSQPARRTAWPRSATVACQVMVVAACSKKPTLVALVALFARLARLARLALFAPFALASFFDGAALAQSQPPPPSPQLSPDRARTVFFDGTVGAGLARIDTAGVDSSPTLGATWRVGVGWSPSAIFAVGFSFATWQRNAIGTPIHLHALGPCFELTPGGGDGVVVSLAVEYAETDGDAPKRYGGALTPALGYRFAAGSWLAPTVRFGADLARYDGGSAIVPFLELQVRVYGHGGPP